MDIIKGTISAKEFDVVFDEKNGVKLTSQVGKTTPLTLDNLHFVAFERISPKLKTCEMVLVNGQNSPLVVTIDQTLLPQIIGLVQCDRINIGQDPENWSRLASVAQKNNWQKEDWLHVFSEAETDDEESEEWLPGQSDEDLSQSDEDLSSDDDEFLLDNESDSD